MTVAEAITRANEIIPASQRVDVGNDPRWQAMLALREYVADHPEELWAFVVQWGQSEDPDLRTGVATCLLEHLLEEHFDRLFPRVEELAVASLTFAGCFSQCWAFGQTEEPQNLARFEALKARVASSAA